MIYNETIYNTGWNTKKLNQLGTFSRGKSTHRPRDDKRLFEDGKYPFIQTGEVKSSNLFISNHKLNYNDFGLLQSKMWKKGTLCITIAANIIITMIVIIKLINDIPLFFSIFIPFRLLLYYNSIL